MNRRTFLRNLFASSATVVVAPAVALEMLDDLHRPARTYFDMSRTPASDLTTFLESLGFHSGDGVYDSLYGTQIKILNVFARIGPG